MIPNLDYWILQTIALLLTGLVVPRLTVEGPISALVSVIALGYVNSTIWDAALFFQIPDSFTMHALTVFAANGVVFWIFIKIMPGISVRGFLPAFFAPVVFSIISLLLYHYARGVDWVKLLETGASYVSGVRDQLRGAAPQGLPADAPQAVPHATPP